MKLKSIAIVTTVLITLYPIGEAIYSYYQACNSGLNRESAKRFSGSDFAKRDTVSQISFPFQNTLEKPLQATDLVFEKNLVIGTTNYKYCFSCAKEFEGNNLGIFHIYRKDTSAYLAKLMISSNPTRFPKNGLHFRLNKPQYGALFNDTSKVNLIKEFKDDIHLWLRSN